MQKKEDEDEQVEENYKGMQRNTKLKTDRNSYIGHYKDAGIAALVSVASTRLRQMIGGGREGEEEE